MPASSSCLRKEHMADTGGSCSSRSLLLCAISLLLCGGQRLHLVRASATPETKDTLGEPVLPGRRGNIDTAWGGGNLYPGQDPGTDQEPEIRPAPKIILPGTFAQGPPSQRTSGTVREPEIEAAPDISLPGTVVQGPPPQLMNGAGPVSLPAHYIEDVHLVEAKSSTQILFGWVPDPAAHSPTARNHGELRRMLRDENLINAITVTGLEKRCSSRYLVDIRQLSSAFKEAIREEKTARADLRRLARIARSYQVKTPANEKQGVVFSRLSRTSSFNGEDAEASTDAEFSLLEQTWTAQPVDARLSERRRNSTHEDVEQALDRPGSVASTEAALAEPRPRIAENRSTPLPQPVTRKNQDSEAGNPTEKRLLGEQLKLYLQCKLAALLGHPHIFLNPHYTDLQLLEAIAEALGLNPLRDGGRLAGQGSDLLAVVELMHMAVNPFVLGHLLLLAIAHLEAPRFFSATPTKSFYAWATLASASVGETAFTMLDEMCEIERGTRRTRNKTWYQKGGSRKHLNPEMNPLVQHMCNLLEILLNGIHEAITDSLDELTKYNVSVEPLVDPGTNSARIQTRLCRGLLPVCVYEDTILFPTTPLSDQERLDSLQTKIAFSLLTAFGSGQVGPIEGNILTPFKNAWGSQWSALLTDPTAYSAILEKSLGWDTREFLAAKDGFFFSAVQRMEKRSYGTLQLNEKGLIDLVIKEKLDRYMQGHAEHVEKIRSAKRRAAEMMNPLNIAILLSLSSGQLCARTGSFLFNLKQFLVEHYKKVAKGKQVPASQRSLMAFVRTGQVELYYNWCNFDPLSPVYLFLLRYALSGADAAALYDKQHAAVTGTKKSLKILRSKWTPSLLKRLVRGFNQNALTQQAKKFLLRSLKPTIFSGILTAFDFVTHTHANMVVNQKASMFHDVTEGSRRAAGSSGYALHRESLAKYADQVIKEWAEYGVPENIKRRLSKGETLPQGVNFGNIAIPNLSQWDTQMSSKWNEAYEAYLRHPYGRAATKAGDPLALLVKESRDRLQKAMDTVVFLGRVASPTRPQGGAARVARAFKTFFMSLLREEEMSETAVWFGVKVDITQIMQMCRAINAVAEVVKDDRMYSFITDAWIEIVKDVVAIYTDMPTRIPDYDFNSVASTENRANKVQAAISRNQGFLNLHHSYNHLSEEERKREFQHSMCADHCVALWHLIMGFVMTNLQNPAKLRGYEQDFANAKEIERLNDPHRVNAFRFGLSVQMDFYDNIIDKQSKKTIKQMKHGASLWFAYAMKLAGQVNSAMAYPNLGMTLYMQAPYMGNYVREWIEQRKEARKKAIIGMLTLGLMGMYTMLSVTDIANHMQDIGAGPPVQCVENLLLGPGCAPQAIAQATTNAVKVAAQDVFKVGLFASISPYLMLPMAIISVWNILKSEIKILLQFEMAVKHLFGRMKRWLARPFKNWWEKRKTLKDSLLKRASNTFNKTKEETKQEPQPRDLHDPSNWGEADLDSLGLPPERAVQEFDLSYRTPAFPLSAPLICLSAQCC